MFSNIQTPFWLLGDCCWHLSGQRPEMLLNLLSYTDSLPPPTHNKPLLIQNINNTDIQKHWCERKIFSFYTWWNSLHPFQMSSNVTSPVESLPVLQNFFLNFLHHTDVALKLFTHVTISLKPELFKDLTCASARAQYVSNT